jgi:hypothetical protein
MIPQPVITPIPDSGGQAMLCVDFFIKLPLCGRGLLVAKGFQTDGASIPEPVWSIIDCTPFDPDTLAAAIVHDALYASEILPREDADKEFEELLKRNSRKGSGLHWIFFEAVRIGGSHVWANHTPQSVADARRFVSLSES